MKHVFLVHSNTCYIASIGAIKHLKLDPADVIIILARNLPELDKEYSYIHMNDDLYYFPFLRNNQLQNLKFLQSKKRIEEIDNIVEEKIDGDFIFYTHNSRNYLYRVFITNSKCHEIRFIEDGLDMYLSKSEYEAKYPRTVWLRHQILNYILGHLLGIYLRLKQENNPFANKGTEIITIFRLNEKSFSKFINPEYNIVTVPSGVISAIQDYRVPEKTDLFVFSALVEQYVANQEEILKVLSWTVEDFNISKLHLNFHPHQSKRVRAEIVEHLEKLNVEVIIIPDDIIMEVLFINNSKLSVYGIGTSLLIYAVYFSPSSTVYALYPLFERLFDRTTIRTKYWANTFENIVENNFKLLDRDFD